MYDDKDSVGKRVFEWFYSGFSGFIDIDS